MTSKYLHPAMDTDGWLQSTVKVVDAMMSDFFLSDYSQTSEFPGHVLSFAWLIQNYKEDIVGLRNALQNGLASYFATQFDNVDVTVEEMPVTDSINRQAIGIYMTFVDGDGVQHNLARIIKHDDMKVNEIIAVVNGS